MSPSTNNLVEMVLVHADLDFSFQRKHPVTQLITTLDLFSFQSEQLKTDK